MLGITTASELRVFVESKLLRTWQAEDGSYLTSKQYCEEFKERLAYRQAEFRAHELREREILDAFKRQEEERSAHWRQIQREQDARREAVRVRAEARKQRAIETAPARKAARLLADTILRAWCTEHPDEAYKLDALALPPATPPEKPRSGEELYRLITTKQVLEKRARGMTLRAIGAETLSRRTGKPLSIERVRQMEARGLRILRHPGHAVQFAQYQQTGTYDNYWE